MYAIIATLCFNIIHFYLLDSVFKAISVLALLGLCYFYRSDKIAFSEIIGRNKAFFVVILLVFASVLRSNHPEVSYGVQAYKIINFSLVVYTYSQLFIYFKIHENFDFIANVYHFIMLPLACQMFLNIVLWLMGVQLGEDVFSGNAEQTESILMKSFGVNMERVQLPMSGGFNNYAVVLGALLTFSLALIFIIKRYILPSITIAGTAFLLLLFIDSRSSIVFPIMLLLLFLVIRHLKQVNFLRLSMIWFFFGTLLMMFLLPLIAELAFAESFSRSNNDFATGNSRFFIWGIAFMEFLYFSPMHIFGYGEFGHYGSGASLKWAVFFSGFNNPEYKTPHNALLVILFDMGYAGLLLVARALASSLKNTLKNWSSDKPNSILFLSFFLFHLLVSNSESLFGFYAQTYFILFILVFIANFIQHIDLQKNEY